MSDNEDAPQLSAETFLALQEFYKEQEDREKHLLGSQDNIAFDENWQLSQFWYDDETVESLSKLALKVAGPDGKIALISCPSLYKTIKKGLSNQGQVTLYEYDTRFTSYGEDFIKYDYKSPLDVPRERGNTYDLVIADPPFLSDECLTKTAVTIKFLARSKILLCTGAIMENLADRLLSLKKTSLKPQHKHNLANEFCCYANFNIEDS